MTKNSVFFPFALGLFLLIFSACHKKPEATVSWAFFDFPYDYDLTSVKIQSPDNWHIVGGKAWESGIYAHIINQDSIQSIDSIAPKRLNAVNLDNNNNIYTVGYTGYLLSQSNNAPHNWHSNRIFNTLNVLRDVDFINDSTGLAVAGVAYHNGYIFRLEHAHIIQKIDTFQLSVRAVDFISPTNAIAVGYGNILKMQSDGKWNRLPNYGDFYVDVDFPTPTIGYIIGNAGSILKTTDGGQNWTSLQKKNTYSPNKAFRAIRFLDEQNGFITGEHGLLWKTKDGGQNWTIGKGLPDIELQGIDILPHKGVLVGKAGTIITFDPDF